MGEINRINDQLRRAFEGTAWHGPSVQELLADVTAEKAAARRLPNAHTIWEIVLHIAAWEKIVRRRLEGEVIENVPDEEDWPPVRETDEQSWQKALEELKRGHLALREAVSRLDEARLKDTVPGTSYSFYFMLHGVIQHDLYHAGQIGVLKRA